MRGTHDVIAFHALRPGIIPAYARNTCRNDTHGCCTWDHPRVCGEHGTTLGSKRLKRGSSPRMRGTPEKDMEPYQTGGIIPAYAGNTFSATPTPTSTGDHPRACGEHVVVELVPCVSLGSSPRMWGTHHTRPVRGRGTGIIPAYAGNTLRKTKRTVRARDHPRVCGEHAWFAATSYVAAGSSPRMRGTLSEVWVFRLLRGIIPAYAGNTKLSGSSVSVLGDHPRVCGEHDKQGNLPQVGTGSSPRMRGTPRQCVVERVDVGIIPAYAGNTLQAPECLLLDRDHPRVCGEHTLPETLGRSRTGSSPRMRGTRIESLAGRFGRGIIPAYAGNTALSILRLRAPWDHPRVCGEHRLKG